MLLGPLTTAEIVNQLARTHTVEELEEIIYQTTGGLVMATSEKIIADLSEDVNILCEALELAKTFR